MVSLVCNALVLILLCLLVELILSDPQFPDPSTHTITIPIVKQNLSEPYKDKRNAVVMLTHKFDQHAIQSTIKMLDDFLDDAKVTDVIIFHSHYPFSHEMAEIRGNTTRKVDFVNVDVCLSRAPNIPDFDFYTNDPTWTKRGKWAYQSMIRFWFYDIFYLDVMKNVRYYMRIDDDSKFKKVFENVFEILRDRKAIYMANTQAGEVGPHILPGIEKLGPTAQEYVKNNKITVKNPVKWEEAFHSEAPQTYSTNFEVVHLGFFRDDAVREWQEYILKSGGIYKYRWGDAPLRFATLAIFATDLQVLHRLDYGIVYCHPC